MLPPSMLQMIEHVAEALPQFPRLRQIFADTFCNTYTTTLQQQEDGSVFVITGDIPAMWLRDSAAQVRVYLSLAKTDPHFAKLIAGVVSRQMHYVLRDPYANAFNIAANGHCHNKDHTDMSAWIWERKYELDSLCAPLKLAHDLWMATGQVDHLDAAFIKAARLIVRTMQVNLIFEPLQFICRLNMDFRWRRYLSRLPSIVFVATKTENETFRGKSTFEALVHENKIGTDWDWSQRGKYPSR